MKYSLAGLRTVELALITRIHLLAGSYDSCYNHTSLEEEEEGFDKFLPANTADRLCQSWQSCSNYHET